MTFRCVMISQPSYLQVAKSQLQITQDNEKYTVPLQDIACIVINHYSITLSATLLSECAENNVVMITCDKTHLPNGIFHSYLPHSRQNFVLKTQIQLTQPFKKRLWQTIVEQKITNQAIVLKHLFPLSLDINKLVHLAQTVLSGDKNNNEAQASRIYFPCLFGGGFTRINKNRPATSQNIEYSEINGLLNYAYTIIRSLICRSLVGYGLSPTLGLFHDNQLNAFNLADDFIEPYRPYIDWYIYAIVETAQKPELSTTIKARLVDILNHIVIIDNKLTTLLNSIDVMVKSFISCINENNFQLIKLPSLPQLIQRSNMD